MNPLSVPEISVIILCYRSGEYVRIFYKKVSDILCQNNLDYEIVLVGNYRPETNDNTPEIVKEISASDSRVRTVIKEKKKPEQAMGWDMRSGFEAATGQTIAVIDGDGQMPPEDIPKLYDKLTKEHLDLCKGRRISRGDGLYRQFVSIVFNALMHLLFPGIVSNDINGKPKIFSREAYEKMKLKSNDWFIDAEIMLRARHFGMRVGEIEVKFHENEKRQSFISFKANFEFIKNIILYRIKEFKNQ